jgi:GAF domain-containing protein
MAKTINLAGEQSKQRRALIPRKTNANLSPKELRAAGLKRIASSAAARTQLIHDMAAANLSRLLANGFNNGRDLRALLEQVLDTAIAVTHADFGNIQLLDPSTGDLRIFVQRGFSQEFLTFFNQVHEGQAACGEALRTLARVLVEDVTHSPVFQDKRTLEVMLAADVRAVQATPLKSTSGELLGMLSTHFRRPTAISQPELRRVDLIAANAAHVIERWARHREARIGLHVHVPRNGSEQSAP